MVGLADHHNILGARCKFHLLVYVMKLGFVARHAEFFSPMLFRNFADSL